MRATRKKDVDPADYCVVCGDDAIIAWGRHPLCVNHFWERLQAVRAK